MDKEKTWFSKSKKQTLNSVKITTTVAEMRTWMRNLEQRLMSLSARLGAVENRLSGSSLAYDQQHLDESADNKHGLLQQAFSMDESTIEQVQRIQNEFKLVTNLLSDLEKRIVFFETFKDEAKKEIALLHSQKKGHAVMMRFGEKKIPLELTGLIGAAISFVVAILVFFDYTEVVLSTTFLIGIGCLFLLTSFLQTKTAETIGKKVRFFLFPQSRKSSVHHSDSSS